MRFTGAGGGFSAYGGAVTLRFDTAVPQNGAAYALTWGTTGHPLNLGSITLNDTNANNTIELKNSLNLDEQAGTVTRTIAVNSASLTNTATLSGVLADGTVGTDGIAAGTTGLTKAGAGVLVLTAANTFTGPVIIGGAGSGKYPRSTARSCSATYKARPCSTRPC